MTAKDVILARKLGGSGFEYDFIIKSTDSESYTLETGTYDLINSKVGNQPVKGKIIINGAEGKQRFDIDCVFVNYDMGTLRVTGFAGETAVVLTINPDNTVTLSV